MLSRSYGSECDPDAVDSVAGVVEADAGSADVEAESDVAQLTPASRNIMMHEPQQDRCVINEQVGLGTTGGGYVAVQAVPRCVGTRCSAQCFASY